MRAVMSTEGRTAWARKSMGVILAPHLIHTDLGLLAHCVICEHNAHSVFALLALDLHGVAAGKLQLGHGVEMQGDHAVVVVDGVIDDQSPRQRCQDPA